MAKENEVGSLDRGRKPILVCAPSNTAVDNIIERLHQEKPELIDRWALLFCAFWIAPLLFFVVSELVLALFVDSSNSLNSVLFFPSCVRMGRTGREGRDAFQRSMSSSRAVVRQISLDALGKSIVCPQ